ncbi:UDP-glycosyltransferase 85A5 [Acorus calamus]|uniref:UDP-glycosyltransferase 85A5 n=1 Tax=Acorus calamus TaxID=4465 RepID=A0AAV9ERK8_ACOCL|nr:UDP-glycosyltransferase 85A5 [Acorus calamus]
MLGLSELFTTAGLRVTFITTEHNLRKLPTSSAGYMSFRAVPDGHDRSGRHIGARVESLRVHATPVLRAMQMGSCGGGDEGSSPPPVTCAVTDGIMSFLIDLAEELVIPVFCFRAISACCLWSFLCLPRLIEDGVLPFHDETDMDERIQSVPGMEGFLRRRDLPSFCRTKELADPTFQLHLIETQAAIRCSGLILNTLDPLESTVLSHIRSQIPNVYPICPIHAAAIKSTSTCMGSLRDVDRSCKEWLDAQPPKSIVYVSFESIAVMSRDQLLELVNSGQRFCGPRTEVLSYAAVGGFLTHSGWNSTLESMFEGVPMLCWPFFTDQQINSRYVSEVGLDMKDTCDRVTVERMVRELMEGVRSDCLRRSAVAMAEKAKGSVGEGGSSCVELKRLVNNIRSIGTRECQSRHLKP